MNNRLRPMYPVRHISIRVPWHDAGWDGTVCKQPKLNGACLKLKNIALNRDDQVEAKVAGRLLSELDQDSWPCCVTERSAFMAPFDYVRHAVHPYTESSPDSHGHFAPTPVRHPPYSAPAVPFSWTLWGNLEQYAQEFQLDVDPNREPELGFKTSWVQDRDNQKALLDCFFGHIRPEESLCFFYAKQAPFVEEFGRVLVGVGRVQHVGPGIEYEYRGKGELRSMLWERMIQHSIRPDFKDGFLLPYHAAMARAEEDPDFNPAQIVAFAPDDRILEFSYASEHVTHDAAISSLLACATALHKAGTLGLEGPWGRCLKWIDQRVGELWRMRGPCPGLGAVLCAFGIEHGTFVAREIAAKVGDNEDPWPLVDKVFQKPKEVLSSECAKQIGATLCKAWKAIGKERRALMKLLSRFEILPDEATMLYVEEEREQAGIECSDSDILANPYLIYELTRLTPTPVSVWTIDRGAFPDPIIRDRHPLPEPSAMDTGTDARRIRALTVSVLETAAANGNTLLPCKDAILRIREIPLQPGCDVNKDLMGVAEEQFLPHIAVAKMDDGSPAYQLVRLSEMGDVIRQAVGRRLKGKRHEIKEDWRRLLDVHLKTPIPDDMEERARQEKTAALKELAESRLSVLIGPAGTGKTTLLSVLCSQQDIAAGEVLLLAPTGKARVRMEQATRGLKLRGYTLAQFLSPSRYDGQTGRYMLSDAEPEDTARTVIVDEASMLTEEMLAALLDALKGVHRLILIGDPRQLPPIGPGRPFVDVVASLRPENVHAMFPRVGAGYAELTIRRRQAGQAREDLQLAEWFGGAPLAPGEDEVFDTVVKTGSSNHVRFVQWNSPEEVQANLIQVLVEELKLKGPEDIEGFDDCLGATESNGYRYFNNGAAQRAESWQILSPVRSLTHGVAQINRFIHKRFRSKMLKMARERYRKIPKPMGAEEIVYGDKVINVRNHRHKEVYPKQEENAAYIANGEIGIAVGQFRSPKIKVPWLLKVEFSSQPGYQYDFGERQFGEESDPTLELAYALTVHKAQGSEFELVILVLPNPCRLLSRELLYTALTRQRQRVVILHQGNRTDLKKYACDGRSETANRLTNLFAAPRPVEIEGRFFEDRLINRTRRGELVRSKSEVIIADRLADLNVDYSYERELTIDGVTRFPDFTIEDDESGRVFYWEHCGMLHVPDYRARWEAKLRWYKHHGILPQTEGSGSRGTLIITADNERGGISSQEIERLIRNVILA